MRNLLFFCILPMIRNLVDGDKAAHLGLFTTGIRVSMKLKTFQRIKETRIFLI
jgi:hypothetical protein